MKLTVAPAMTPARACPRVGRRWSCSGDRGWSRRAKLEGEADMRSAENRVWWSSLR